MKKAIFLFDYTGIMARPWADAGYLCYCFDGQHPEGVTLSDQHKKLGGRSLKTKNIRSATPRGFAQAVFEANAQ